MLSIRKGLALTLVTAMAIAAGCSGKQEETQGNNQAANNQPSGPVKISFWHGMDPKSSHGQTLQALVKEFNEKNQGKIEVSEAATPSYTDLEKKITTAIASNDNPPTIVQATDSMLTNLVKAGVVQPIDSFVPAGDRADYVPSLLTAVTYDGKLMALPFNKSMIVVIYDKTVVKTPPKNWTEFKQVAKEATIKDKRFGAAIEPNVYTFGTHFAQAGGEWIKDGKAAFNSDAGVEALKYLADMVKEGVITQTKPREYQSDYFNQGRAAMIATTSASYAFIKPVSGNEWGVAPLYAGPKNDAVPLSGANVALLSTAKPDEQKAAATFLLWLTGKEGTLKWATGKTGYMPIRKSAFDTDEWKKFVKDNPIYEPLGVSMSKGVVQPNHPQWQAVQKEITSAVEKVFLGQADPKTALDEAAAKANDLLKK